MNTDEQVVVVGRESPRNKSGTPMVSDIDLLFARPDQLLETLVRTINKWKK